MQTKLSISVKTEPTNNETPDLLNKLRTLISANLDTTLPTNTTEFELINKMATLTEKDLKNNKYKDLFHDITIKIKQRDFKNIEKLITKKFIKKTKNIEFCSAFNSARKLFLIYILNLKKAENSREVLLYTNIINNLCLHNANEFLQNVALMFAGELNLNRGLLRTFVVENFGIDGVAPLIEDLDYKYFNMKSLEEIYNDSSSELGSLKNIENIGDFKEVLNNETLEIKKLLESGASYKFLKKTNPLPPCYYLYSLQLEDTYFNDLNIRVSIQKIGEFLLSKSVDEKHTLIKFLIRYIRLLLREGSDSVKYECLVLFFKLLENGNVLTLNTNIDTNTNTNTNTNTDTNQEVNEIKEVINYKYKGKSKTAKLQQSKNSGLKKELTTSLTNLEELLFYELLLKTNTNLIRSLLNKIDLSRKIKKLIPIFNIHLLKIKGLIKKDTSLLLEIYRYTTTDDEKLRVLKEIPSDSLINSLGFKEAFKFNEKDSKELSKLKILKIKGFKGFPDDLVSEYLNVSGDLFYEACEISKDLLLPLKTIDLIPEKAKVFEKTKDKILENIKTYPDAVALSLIKLIKTGKIDFKEKKEEIFKVFNCLLEFSRTCSYEKYTNVYLCRGDLETLNTNTLPNSSDISNDLPNTLINTPDNKSESKNTLITNKRPTSASVSCLQMTSFSEILYIEASHEIKNTELFVNFTVINQSLIPIFEIQITPLTKLRVKKYIPEFLIKQRSIDKKSFIFELQTNYTAPLKDSLNFRDLKSLEPPLFLNFVVSFKYTKNDVRKQEVLNLKPLEISMKTLLKQPSLKNEEFISLWKKMEWERLQVLKQLSDFNETFLRGFQLIKSLKYKNTKIMNLVTSLNGKYVFVNLLGSEDSLRIRVRSESRNLVDGVSEYLRGLL